MNKNITIYYSEWDGKNGSHDLLKRAAAQWCGCHDFMDHFSSGQEEIFKTTDSPLKNCQEEIYETYSSFKICQEDKWKKPYFEEPEGVKFSISHSGNLWMCAIADTEVGLDVQEENSCKRDRISKRFFHPKETQWLSAQDYRDFFRVWAAKESYVKYIGDGLVYGMEKFCVVDEQGLAAQVERAWQQHFLVKICEDGDLVCCDTPGADVLSVCLTTETDKKEQVVFKNLKDDSCRNILWPHIADMERQKWR